MSYIPKLEYIKNSINILNSLNNDIDVVTLKNILKNCPISSTLKSNKKGIKVYAITALTKVNLLKYDKKQKKYYWNNLPAHIEKNKLLEADDILEKKNREDNEKYCKKPVNKNIIPGLFIDEFKNDEKTQNVTHQFNEEHCEKLAQKLSIFLFENLNTIIK